MIYKDLRSFFDELFKDKGREIVETTMKKQDISDIDNTTSLKRKRFAEYILEHHFNFSFQKNKYLYNRLLSTLDIHQTYDIADYKETVEKIKEKEKQRLINAVDEYWESIESAYYRYESLLNLFWSHAVDSEMKGVNHSYISGLIRIMIKNNMQTLKNSHMRLLDALELKQYLLLHHREKPKFTISEEDDEFDYNLPDKENLRLMLLIEEFRLRVEKHFDSLNSTFSETLSYDFLLKIRKMNDETLIHEIQAMAQGTWGLLHKEYNKLRTNIINEEIKN